LLPVALAGSFTALTGQTLKANNLLNKSFDSALYASRYIPSDKSNA